MKLRNSDIQTLANAIARLGGRAEQVSNGDGKPAIVVKPYDLPGKVIYALARTKAHLKPHVEAITEATQAMLRTHTGPDKSELDGKADPKAWNVFQGELADLMRTEVEVEVHQIAMADLKIETNKLDPNLVADLLPILTGDVG